MKSSRSLAMFACLALWPAFQKAGADDAPTAEWKQALPGFEYQFPADHHVHPDFKTEWWYFTGHLETIDRHSYGYELTFFRQGMLSPGTRPAGEPDGEQLSRFVRNDFKFAHFAVSDLTEKRFHYVEKLSRGAFGEAGFGQGSEPRLAWLEDWALEQRPDGSWHLLAATKAPVPMRVDLILRSAKPPAIEGMEGVSQKAAGVGNASHYYSFTQMESNGSLSVGEGADSQDVHGASWFDHEWASNQLAADQVGWDWFCVQFADRTELMLYAMRRRDGSIDPASAGTLVDAAGATEHLAFQDFQMRATHTWKSKKTGAVYPISWEVVIPRSKLRFTIDAQLDDQELALPLISYWEGATAVKGERGGRPLMGLGYMELTGYAAELQALKARGAAGNGVGALPR